MPLPLPQYAKIKDNYCIAYFGNCKEHIVQLKLLRPMMENTFPGVSVHLACRDDCTYLLQGEERIITKTELKENKHNFAYIRELLCDMNSHPVEEFMKESGIPCGPIKKIESKANDSCVLLTDGITPVASLTANQIKSATLYIQSQGCPTPYLNGCIDAGNWIVGVENEMLYEAAAQGKRVTLIPTGFGENIFKCMFPGCEILKLAA